MPEPSNRTPGALTRRSWVRVMGTTAAVTAAAACAPAAAPAPGPAAVVPGAAPAWQRQWDQTVELARKEGRLALVTDVGPGYRKLVDAFQAEFPGISVDHTSMIASQFAPRLAAERQAGLYAYDVNTSSVTIHLARLLPEGVLAPVRPLLFRSDVVDDANWVDGFDAGWLDKEKRYAYGASQELTEWLWINTDIVKDGEITKVEDLTNPKWKGKILAGDPRTFGGGWLPATVMRLGVGDDIIKRVWKDQEAVLGRDQRVMMDSMIRGTFPIAIGGVFRQILNEFLDKGIGKNLKPLHFDHMDNIFYDSTVLYFFNRAPNPNAAKVFANWVLTKRGQELISEAGVTNSRRKDVEAYSKEKVVPPGRKLMLHNWEMLPAIDKTAEIARQVLN